MVAPHHRKQPLRVGELAFLDVLDPGPIHADRYIMLRLARDGAGMTSNASSVVDNKTEIRQELPLSQCFQSFQTTIRSRIAAG